MSDDKDWLPKNAQISTAYLTVNNAKEAIEFYKKAFGFEVVEAMDGPDGDYVHVTMSYLGSSVIMFHPENSPMNKEGLQCPKTSGQKNPIGIFFYTPNCDEKFKQAIDAGATKLMEPFDMFWGDRMAGVLDPSGYNWNIMTKFEEFDESKRPKFD